ncbi:hypothetical protein Golob_024388, partial [Gossypium lobatum]|nr:hypothetical protein [Gossypium lobatum]
CYLQFGGDGNDGGEGGEVVGSKCGESEGEGGKVVGSKGGEGKGGDEGENAEVAGSKGGEGVEGQGIGESGEVAEGLGREGDDVAVSKGGESDGSGEEGVRDESDSDLEDENAYLMNVMYLSNNDDEEEFQEARQKVNEVEGKTSRKGKEIVLDETESESSGEQFELEVLEEVDVEGLNDSVGRKMEIRLNILIVMIIGACLGQKTMTILMFFEEEVGSPHTVQTQQVHTFVLGYCLKMVKIFHDEHNCCVNFRNKTINVKVIAEHFEATIGDNPKMKLMEIQRREFAMLWDYVHELRLKNGESTIKMAVNRVTPESLPHFK